MARNSPERALFCIKKVDFRLMDLRDAWISTESGRSSLSLAQGGDIRFSVRRLRFACNFEKGAADAAPFPNDYFLSLML